MKISSSFETDRSESGASRAALGDIDLDGDLDLFVTTNALVSDRPSSVWLNDGSGFFFDSRVRLGESDSEDVELGDFDGDGNLDAFVANNGRDEVWLNTGWPMSYESIAQPFDDSPTQNVAIGDLDGDGDLDAVVVQRRSERSARRLWAY